MSEMELLQLKMRHRDFLDENDKLREALGRIGKLTAGGPHMSAKAGMAGALDALDQARDIARAALGQQEKDK